MAATKISDIAAWVTADVLKRGDIDTVAQTCAINTYLLVCAAVPFDELMITSAEVNTVVGQVAYDLASLTPALRAIQSIRFTFDTGNRRRLRRSSTRLYDSLSITPSSRTATYSRWGTKIELNPPPDSAAYTYRVRYWSRPTIAATPANTDLLTPLEWDELLRWETLYRVYYELDQHEKAMTLVQPSMLPRQPGPKKQMMFEAGIIPRLWNDLLRTVSAKENTDEDFSINPIMRAYSSR